MATFASNGNFATSVMNIAFSLASTSPTHKGTKNSGLARPSYYTNTLLPQEDEISDDDDFEVEFRDDFSIIYNKWEPLVSTKSTTTPKSILKEPKGTKDHDKPKKAVVWHTELAHDIVNGEHVPQTQLSREMWYPMKLAETEAKLAQDSEWVDVSDDL
ncbi:hypothetical protein PG985_012196 [Apiospora marii]|uniref:Uncharacterized protein n=1 Tax=Apiospora marii TaxID=335849 RepID=A0ABR1REY8_9PEZI